MKKVICLSNENYGFYLTVGNIYEVQSEDGNYYSLKDDSGDIDNYPKIRFQENIELNIIQASNMPYDTEFKVKIDCYYKYNDTCRIRDNTKLIAINTQSGIKFKEYEDIERASKTLINAKFIVQIPQLVTFEEARKEYRENKKTIKSCISERVFKNGIDIEIGFSEIEGQWIVLD